MASNFSIPCTKEGLSVQWLNSVMEPEGFQVARRTFLGDANEGRGCLSSLERVELELRNGKKLTVILKTLPADPGVRAYVIQAGFATREVQMYSRVFRDFQKFLASRNVSTEKYMPRIPKCYYAREEGVGESYSMILILEDLAGSGFKPWAEGAKKDLDWERTSATIRELARFHALSAAYGVVNNLSSYQEVYPFLMNFTAVDEDENLGGYLKAGFGAVKKLFEEENGEVVPNGLLERLSYMETVVPVLIKERGSTNRWVGLRHNDVHSGNLFFSDQGDSVTAALIDFQACLNDAPMYDLCFFQLLCCDLRASSLDLSRSIEAYHEVFTEAMSEMKVSLAYSAAEMRAEFERTLLISLMHIISGAPIWCFGPDSNQVSRQRISRAIIYAYNHNLLNFTPTHQAS